MIKTDTISVLLSKDVFVFAWGSTSKTNLHKVQTKQSHVIMLIFFATLSGKTTDGALPLLNILEMLTVANIYRLHALKFQNLAIICCTTEQVRGMGLFLGLRHKLHCTHVYKDLIRCKSVCDVHPGIDPYPLLARSCNR